MTMPDPPPSAETTDDGIPLFVNGRRLSDVELCALREAKQRRDAAAQGSDPTQPIERGAANRSTDPVRYDDWEINGRAIDFS